MGKENPLKILWRLGQKFHSYILWITLCTVFMIQMIQRKLQFNLLEKTFQLSWSHQPGEYWWQSQCWKEGKKNQMAQVWDMNSNSTQSPTKLCKLYPVRFPFPLHTQKASLVVTPLTDDIFLWKKVTKNTPNFLKSTMFPKGYFIVLAFPTYQEWRSCFFTQ